MQFKLWRLRAVTLATLVLGAMAPAVPLAVGTLPVQASSGGFDSPGNLLISDQFNHRAFIIDPAGALLFQYGLTNDPGFRNGELDGPYTSFAIGDYTGQTVPPSKF